MNALQKDVSLWVDFNKILDVAELGGKLFRRVHFLFGEFPMTSHRSHWGTHDISSVRMGDRVVSPVLGRRRGLYVRAVRDTHLCQ